MKFLSGFVSLAILSATIVSSIPITRRNVNESLVPQFGFSAGVNPTGTGDCDGAVNGTDGQPVKVPCSCPPDRVTFIQSLNANVAAGQVLNNSSVPFSFPEDNSTASQLARVNAAIVTLENLNGTGQGCPVESTTFKAQAVAIKIASPEVLGPILMARELAPSPTSTLAINVSGLPLFGAILARQSAPSPAPTPTISFVLPPVVEKILARDSTPSPSPTHEIIVVGPPVIE